VERATIVMAVLRQVGHRSAGFRDVIDRTEQYWHQAVSHLDGSAAPPAAATALVDFADQICRALSAERIEKFDHTRWTTVETLAGTLKQELAKDARISPDIDARVLFNAAWVARLANPPDDIGWATILTGRAQVIGRSVTGQRNMGGGRRGR